MKFGRNVLKVNMHRLTSGIFDFHDGGNDDILRNKFLPPGDWTRSIWRRLCSTVR